MIDNWTIWLILAVFFIALFLISDLFFISYFAIGSSIADIASIYIQNIYLQFLIFLFTAFLLFISTKFIFTKSTDNPQIEFNIDSYVNEMGIVVKAIDSINGKGLIKVKNEMWSARSDEFIEKDVLVKVIGYEGAHLIVKSKQKDTK